jgi:two-component system chemotaxis response regulator CheY
MATILVVDDSLLSRRLVADPLEAAGHQVVEAGSGELGYTAFAEHHPDVVITDLLMPVMNGQKMLGQIREDSADVAVIVVSADIQNTTRQRCETLGISAFLNKPVNAGDLLAAISTILPITEGQLS